MSKRTIAYVLLVSGGIAWSATPLLITLAAVKPSVLVLMRAVFVSLFLGLFLLPKVKALRVALRDDFKRQLIAAICAVASTSSFAIGCALTAPENVYLLFYLFPSGSLLLDSCIKRKMPSLRQTLLVLGSAFGLSLFVIDNIEMPKGFLGEIAALISAFTWIAFMFVTRKFDSEEKGLNSTLLGQLIGIVIVAPFALYTISVDSAAIPNSEQLLWLLLFGFTSAVPLFAFGWALKHVEPHIAGTISLIEAPIGVFLTWLFLQQEVSLLTAIGGVIIIIAAALMVSEKKA